jgi:hypothetical protein
LLRYPPLCSSLRLVCRRARHPLPAGRLKGCVQRQWQAGPVLTVADPVFLHACGVLAEEASQRGPLPLTSRRSLAGWGGGGCPAISLSLTLFRSRARPPAAKGTRTRMRTFSVLHPCPPLHVAKRVSGKRARLESRPHPLADLRRPVWSRCSPKWDSHAMGMGLLGPALLGTPGAAGLDAGCQAGGWGFTDCPCAWGH